MTSETQPRSRLAHRLGLFLPIEARIVFAYLIIGAVWIYFSDRLVGWLASSPHEITFWSTYKDWLYVAVTGGLLFWMLRRSFTRLRQAHEHLQDSERKYRNIAENLPGVVYQFRVRKDGSMYFSFLSARAMEALGLNGDSRGSNWDLSSHIPPEDRKEYLASLHQAVAQSAPWNYEGRLLAPDGSIKWFHGISSPSHLGNELVYDGVLLDLSERKQMEEALQRLNETLEQRVVERTALAEQRASQLRLLAAELTQAEERERQRVARLLHDQLQQILVASRIKLTILRRHEPDSKQSLLLGEMDGLLAEALRESRSLTASLSPPILYDRGLLAGLQWLARQAQEDYHLTVDLHAETEMEPAELATRILLFQAVRELLLNTAKHAQTSRAVVTVSHLANDRLRFVVSDDGVGFAPAELQNHSKPSGFGLFSIRERLELIGGRMEVTSAPGQGTRVTLEAPIGRTASAPADSSVEPAPLLRGTDVAPREPSQSLCPPTPIRVLLADDHAILRQGLAGLLREHGGVEVVGEAADGQQAVEMAVRTRPEVILMDISMPGMSGIEATRRIVATLPQTRVIGLSMHDADDMATAMTKAGAVAYLRKDAGTDAVLTALRRYGVCAPSVARVP